MTREEAISRIRRALSVPNRLQGLVLIDEESANMAIEALSKNNIDRPYGEWIKATGMMPPEFHGHHCCSECGNFANMEPPFGNREDLSNYCSNCGARMKGSAE